MSEEQIRRNNILMNHGNLPYDMSTCETYGIAGYCGEISQKSKGE